MRQIIVLCLALGCLVSVINAQQDGRREKLQCVITPPDQGLIAVASQPDSPLVFENVKGLSCIGGGGLNSYQLRNRGTKPIRAFTIAGWSSIGTGHRWSWGANTPEELIMPGQFAPIKGHEVEIVPLTEELRKKLKLKGPMKGVAVLMVVNVEYADGTSYDNEATSKALEAYFEEVGAKVY